MAELSPSGASSNSSSIKGPTSDRDRIVMVDIIRGFALFGVILVNFQSLISWDNLQGVMQPAIEWFMDSFIFGRFYRLFAFLFGLGFALQMARLQARGIRFVPLYFRRLFILFLFGVVHTTLFWQNDILTVFAQFGVLLLLMRNLSDRSLLVAAVICLLASHVYYYASTGLRDFRQPLTEQVLEECPERRDAEQAMQEAETHRIRSEGTFMEVARWNIRTTLEWRSSIQVQLALMGEEFLMMLLGLYAGRKRIIQNMPQSIPFIKKIAWWGLAVGAVGHILVPVLSEWSNHLEYRQFAITARLILVDLQTAGLSLCYASVLALVLYRTGWRWRPVSALGRMTLTNYLLLSIIVTTLLLDYGAGLYPDISIVGGLVLSVLTIVVMMLFSQAWLRRFRFGPAEWLWRSLTYGKRQALRLPPRS